MYSTSTIHSMYCTIIFAHYTYILVHSSKKQINISTFTNCNKDIQLHNNPVKPHPIPSPVFLYSLLVNQSTVFPNVFKL